jgi:hypothetical protein
MVRLEIVVHQNQAPRTRPETFDWEPRKGGQFPLMDLRSGFRTYVVGLTGVVPITAKWWSLLVELRVSGPKLCEPRPGVVFGEPVSVPTVTYFPSVAPEESELFGGWFTVSLRVTR